MKNILFVLALCAPAYAGLVMNGGFESGLTGWTIADQIGSDGTFQIQSGTTSPVNSFPVPAPPEGSNAAMTDSQGPGSHVLYQDIMIPSSVMQMVAHFSLYIRTDAEDFVTPPSLDFATSALNQRARVDLISATADPFSLDPADVLMNLFETKVGDPLVSGYNTHNVDVTSVLQAFAGQTIRLRFAEVDNVATFNFGVDQVDIDAVPEPGTFVAGFAGLVLMGLRWRR